MKTPDEYRESLRDGRVLYLRGRRVEDITLEPGFAVPLANGAADYDYDADPDLRTYIGESGERENRLFQIPRSEEELALRVELMRTMSPVSASVGALFALLNAEELLAEVNPDYARNVRALYERCRDEDLRIAQLVTDPKGDRSRKPLEQDDPDLYLHVVERRDDGIVVRGAKMHITGAALVHEFIVLPTRGMGPGEEDYAVAFAVPANAPGIKIINRDSVSEPLSTFDYPVSGAHQMPEGLVVFDDVFVPNDRIFLLGEQRLAAKLTRKLGLWERVLGLAGMVDRARLLVGAAQLLADYNGIGKASHVMDKITDLIFYAETLDMALQSAIHNYKTTPSGMVYPDGKSINLGKYYGASNYHLMVRNIHDLCGAIVLTLPTEADYRNPELTGDLEKYLHTHDGVTVEERMRLYNLVRDITADTRGGWDMVTTLQSGGGLAAQKILTYRGFDMDGAKALARRQAGLDD
ncbi:MAG: 4-hydroxyphenylacetate 3-hydroxylase [Candidatus Hydrogenedentota bacterium]|nr:MAG: 4-hydroxyphenylacetate 3-hydroxylase [Candidatus Hydrogenedentota bacterium]